MDTESWGGTCPLEGILRGRGVPSVRRHVGWDVSFALNFDAVLLRKASGPAGTTKGGHEGWEWWGGAQRDSRSRLKEPRGLHP